MATITMVQYLPNMALKDIDLQSPTLNVPPTWRSSDEAVLTVVPVDSGLTCAAHPAGVGVAHLTVTFSDTSSTDSEDITVTD
jgi:hypothetical protein